MNFLAFGVLAGLATTATAADPAPLHSKRTLTILGSAIVDVPFVIEPASVQAGGTMLWVKGDAPADPVLARFTIRPLEAAWLISPAKPDQPIALWRAFPGGRIGQLQANMVPMASGPRYYCGPIGGSPGCVIDDDGDGTVDRMASAMAEQGRGAYHITVIRPPEPVPVALRYRLMTADERPQIKVELHNCGKDYDRPRYQARAMIDDARNRNDTPFVWHDKDSSLGGCPRGQTLPAWRGGEVQPPKGGFITALGPLAFTVGPRGQPTLGLLGLLLPQALYRLEGATLINLTSGPTPSQAQLLALQKFPDPILMALPGGRVETGAVAAGQPFLSLPFRHAYRGRLTSEVKISTLLSKRSVPAGTIVYGFPGRSRTVVTQNGFPLSSAQTEGEVRNINLELTWCTPVQQPDFVPRPDEPLRTGWTASCLPHSNAGTHTIIENITPALAASGVSYDVFTSANAGPVPVKRDDAAEFDQPLRAEYVFDRLDGESLVLRRQLWLGTALTSTSVERLYAPGGKASIMVAGAIINLAVQPDGKLDVRTATPIEPGEDINLARVQLR